MLEKKELASIPFLKKSAYTGSHKGIRFKLQKKEAEENILLEAFIWPEPFCFDKTPAEKIQSKIFDFSDQGLEEATQWMNEQLPIYSSLATPIGAASAKFPSSP